MSYCNNNWHFTSSSNFSGITYYNNINCDVCFSKISNVDREVVECNGRCNRLCHIKCAHPYLYRQSHIYNTNGIGMNCYLSGQSTRTRPWTCSQCLKRMKITKPEQKKKIPKKPDHLQNISLATEECSLQETGAETSQKTPLLEAIANLMNTGILSDVTFVIGQPLNQKKFQCHRLLFAARSVVFHAMFESSAPENETMKITDIEPDTFDGMRRYIYTDEMELKNMEEAIKTNLAANKFNLVDLTELSYKYIEKNITAENVCQVYDLVVYMEKQALKTECEKIITCNPRAVLNGEGFLKCTLEVVKEILQKEGFAERNELFFFQSVLSWAKEECRRQGLQVNPTHTRQVLNPILPYIRFLNMTHEEFVTGPATSKILNNEEMLSISMNIGIPGCTDLPTWFQNAMKI